MAKLPKKTTNKKREISHFLRVISRKVCSVVKPVIYKSVPLPRKMNLSWGLDRCRAASLLKLQKDAEHFGEFLITALSWNQGDQIGRFFAYRMIVYFVKFFT
jgi:hypothetical protein